MYIHVTYWGCSSYDASLSLAWIQPSYSGYPLPPRNCCKWGGSKVITRNNCTHIHVEGRGRSYWDTIHMYVHMYCKLNCINGLPLYSGDVMTPRPHCPDRIPAVETLDVCDCSVVAMETQRPVGVNNTPENNWLLISLANSSGLLWYSIKGL